ncbi:MAG: hypothetical protein HY298_10150 [Verrucomicrobia bacterium]|nr:hypothetical protein [Verrucomicrobiota bacterium]
MKKIILAVTLLAFAGTNIQTASAGDREWATAGKVLTGIAAASIIANAIDYRPGYYAPTYYPPAPPVYYAPPPVVYASPAPVVVYPPPVYVRPAPVVSFSFGFGGCYPRHYYGGYHGGRPHYRVCR